jgi:2-dehydro-3-deoxyphosphogalactonate aldolase
MRSAQFESAFAACTLIAILRGIRPDEAIAIADVLHEAGIRIIEVPLNSPDPFESIDRLVGHLGERAVIGAGTVTSVSEVDRLKRIGAHLVVSPHADPAVIAATVAGGLISVPGAFSPSEIFAAVKAGAHAVKLFPMEMIGVAGVKAMRAVLPKDLRLIAVGGINAETIPPLAAAGCDGFGVGSTLYRPGDGATSVRARAADLIACIRRTGNAPPAR